MRPSWGMCPNCGKPVNVWGNRWKCGWCGMGGLLNPQTTATVTMTLSVEPTPLNLQKTWTGLKVALRGRCPEFGQDLRNGLRKVALHEIAQGIGQAKRGPGLAGVCPAPKRSGPGGDHHTGAAQTRRDETVP